MVQQELLAYIRENLGRGFNEAQIRTILSQHGYPGEVIDEAFQITGRDTPKTPFPRKLALGMAAVLLIPVISVLLVMLLSSSPPGNALPLSCSIGQDNCTATGPADQRLVDFSFRNNIGEDILLVRLEDSDASDSCQIVRFEGCPGVRCSLIDIGEKQIALLANQQLTGRITCEEPILQGAFEFKGKLIFTNTTSTEPRQAEIVISG